MKDNLVELILENKEEFAKLHNEDNNIEILEADFSRANLVDMDFANIDFSGSTFLEGTLENCKFDDCDLTSVDFSRSNLTECSFTGAILNGTVFNYAQVHFCNFSDADMAGASFQEADLTDSDFSTSENLDSCRFDEGTVWPEIEKLPEDFDCTYNYDLSSLREDEEESDSSDVY